LKKTDPIHSSTHQLEELEENPKIEDEKAEDRR